MRIDARPASRSQPSTWRREPSAARRRRSQTATNLQLDRATDGDGDAASIDVHPRRWKPDTRRPPSAIRDGCGSNALRKGQWRWPRWCCRTADRRQWRAQLRVDARPCLPVSALDMATRTISGTPTALQAATSYSWTVTDADGDTANVGLHHRRWKLTRCPLSAMQRLPTDAAAAALGHRHNDDPARPATGGNGDAQLRADARPCLPASALDMATRTRQRHADDAHRWRRPTAGP